MNFPDGSCEAIVGFCRLKDGLGLLRWKRVQPHDSHHLLKKKTILIQHFK